MKNEQFKSYLAGVLDSDGSISIIKKHIYRTTPYYGILVQITWTKKRETHNVFKKLVKIYGGTFHKCKISNNTFKNSKPVLKYGISGKKCQALLEDVHPFLQLKKQQAILAIKMQNTIKYGIYGNRRLKPESIKRKQHLYYEQNKRLNV